MDHFSAVLTHAHSLGEARAEENPYKKVTSHKKFLLVAANTIYGVSKEKFWLSSRYHSY